MNNKIRDPLSYFNNNATNLLFLSFAIENIFFLSLDGIYTSLILILGWILIRDLILTNENLYNYPVSFMMFLGLAIMHFILPMPLTIIELKPVTYNLKIPLTTLTHHFLFLISLILSHKIYTHFSNNKNVFRFYLNKANFYIPPSNRLIWTTAIVSLIISSYNYIIVGAWDDSIDEKSLTFYLNGIFGLFVWMPLIIPFSKFRGSDPEMDKRNIKYIIFYSVIVFIIAIASNWRTILFSGPVILLTLLLMGYLFNFFALKNLLNPKNFIFTVMITLIVTGPLVDFGYAMVIVRGERTSLSPVDLISRTVSEYMDEDSIRNTKILSSSAINKGFLSYNGWNEDYLNNIIANRYVNLKISDNSLYYAEELGYASSGFRDELFKQVESFVPNIVLSIFGTSRSNELLYSPGDTLYSMATKDNLILGSSVVSSMPGVGMALFGYWYLLIVIPLFIILFGMFDSFVYIKDNKVYFSFFFYLNLFTIINYFNDRHVWVFELRYIFRNYFESTFIFLFIFKITNVILRKK